MNFDLYLKIELKEKPLERLIHELRTLIITMSTHRVVLKLMVSWAPSPLKFFL